jgi:hypothetical protein
MTVEFFTVNQMAEITQVSRATIYHMISSGEIIPTKIPQLYTHSQEPVRTPSANGFGGGSRVDN